MSVRPSTKAQVSVINGNAERPPLTGASRPPSGTMAVWLFVLGPFVALAVPFIWGWQLTGLNMSLAATGYLVSGLGLSAGFHRYLTHRSFRARREVKIALAVAGSLAIAGRPAQWVATHRRHHSYADREGDPHSPWRYGTSTPAVAKGLLYAHLGWVFRKEQTNRERFAQDVLRDTDLMKVDRVFACISAISLLAPALVGGLVTHSWTGTWSGLLWGGLWRVAFLHHMTWSVNSICHVIGDRPFKSRDRATNFWPLAILSLGESWHNSHHANPALARHGVLPGQIDISARFIWLLERLGLVYDVRWPKPGHRLDEKNRRVRSLLGSSARSRGSV
jgi:stearoyl-CoA desaturase (Delta-9 desaturase)